MVNSVKDDKVLENLSAIFDGNNLPKDESLEMSENDKDHLQNWSLISSTLKKELPSKINLSLANNVMSRIENEHIQIEKVEETPTFSIVPLIKKVSFALTQVSVAAAIAVIAVIGYQTYNAGVELNATTEFAPSFGNSTSVNLASYQSPSQEQVIHMNNNVVPNNEILQNNNKRDAYTAQKLKEQEMQRLNEYLKGYVLDRETK